MGSIGASKQVNTAQNLYAGLFIEGTPSNQANADEVLKGTRDVLTDFGMNDDLRSVRFNSKGSVVGGEAGASMNGFGDLTVNNNSLRQPLKDSKGYSVSDTFYGLGAHEAGHLVVNSLLRQYIVVNDGNHLATANLEQATARKLGKLEREILKEAQSRYGSNPKISGYGSTKHIEKVAEAVSDVYANKGSANPYSKVIVDVMRDIKNGKFRPKIKVTKREMGI